MPVPEPTAPRRPPNYLLHGFLFVATCFTTYLAGGPVFAATLMGILLTHEMGHYVVARRHGIDASLPYFIPLPFSTGTLGAVIKMNSPIQRRDALVDVGAAGPLAGLVVAIPLLVIGLVQSPVAALPPAGPEEVSLIEGNSLLYIGLKLITKGQYLPSGDLDVHLGPMAMAAWVGLLVTFINLIPIGQLDGGHVAYGFFGERHERHSRWLHRGLLAVLGALSYAAQGALPWLVWAGLLLGMRRLSGGLYHPPVGPEPLSRSRRVLFWIVAIVFLLLFTPVPMREAL
jgi:membrane-associated protease RseP (regulator of RpoE activity)